MTRLEKEKAAIVRVLESTTTGEAAWRSLVVVAVPPARRELRLIALRQLIRDGRVQEFGTDIVRLVR